MDTGTSQLRKAYPVPACRSRSRLMATRVYPRNLYTELQSRWTAPPLDRFPRIDLPEKRIFDELVDVCYHASFMTEEGRPMRLPRRAHRRQYARRAGSAGAFAARTDRALPSRPGRALHRGRT